MGRNATLGQKRKKIQIIQHLRSHVDCIIVSMASEINQVLPLALGQLVNQNQSLGISSPTTTQYTTPRDVAQLTQIAAAQTVSKVKENDKKRSTQVPKRPEPNFSAQDEKPENEPSSLLKYAKRRRPSHDGDLDVVA